MKQYTCRHDKWHPCCELPELSSSTLVNAVRKLLQIKAIWKSLVSANCNHSSEHRINFSHKSTLSLAIIKVTWQNIRQWTFLPPINRVLWISVCECWPLPTSSVVFFWIKSYYHLHACPIIWLEVNIHCTHIQSRLWKPIKSNLF